jgi:ribonuclease HI
MAKYETSLFGLRKLKAMGVKRVVLKSNSQVIIGHVDKSSGAKNLALEKYRDTIRRMEGSFKGFSIKNIQRVENEHVDMLAKLVAQGLLYHPKSSSKF